MPTASANNLQSCTKCRRMSWKFEGNVREFSFPNRWTRERKMIVFHVLFVFYRNLHRPGWVYIRDFGSANCLFHGIWIWDSYYQWWFYNVVKSDFKNARFSRIGVSTNLNLTYKIAKIDCFEGHVWPDCENMSYATTLRIKSLTKDNLGQLRFSREDISVTEDFGRRPQRPTWHNFFALRRNQQTHLYYYII